MFEISENFLKKVSSFSGKYIHIIMIATKPDIIKQASFYYELKKKGENILLIHTGQHYDYNLSGGMLEEFGMEVDLNLAISGAYHEKISQIIARLGDVFLEIKKLGKTPIPYVHGDTMTSMAASNASWALEIACVHVEAGIRTLGLKKQIYKDFIDEKITFEEYKKAHLDQKNLVGGQIEPYPEQFNTRTTEPGCFFYLAPCDLAKQNLINEGFEDFRIKVVGNSVVDATSKALEDGKDSKIFEKFPILEKGFIRFCIHRRENCASEERFLAIFESIENLVKEGKIILLISLFATEKAIDDFGLRQRLNDLKKYENFVYSEPWPFYKDVIFAMKKSILCATDSGSMQEEMNYLGIPTITLRFGTDRPETLLTGGNLIAPVVNSKIITKIINLAINSPEMKNVGNIYGENVAENSIGEVLDFLKTIENPFDFYKI